MLTINRHPAPRDLRIFGLLLGLFLPTLGWLVCRRLGVSPPWGWLAVLSALSITVAVAAPHLLRWLYVGWMTVVFPLGWVVSHVVLAIVYFTVVTPVGWTMRLLGKDPLNRRFDPQAKTYWVRRTPRADRKSYFRPF
ncbi:MAG: SxtJ family membrane protein [Pirellulales bacterium]